MHVGVVLLLTKKKCRVNKEYKFYMQSEFTDGKPKKNLPRNPSQNLMPSSSNITILFITHDKINYNKNKTARNQSNSIRAWILTKRFYERYIFCEQNLNRFNVKATDCQLSKKTGYRNL